MMKRPEDAARWLLERDHFLILTHVRPDGDTTGCAIALCLGLRSLGKDAWIWENPQFSGRFLPRMDGMLRTDLAAHACFVESFSQQSRIILTSAGLHITRKDIYTVLQPGNRLGKAHRLLGCVDDPQSPGTVFPVLRHKHLGHIAVVAPLLPSIGQLAQLFRYPGGSFH